jgi:hypothetical protein
MDHGFYPYDEPYARPRRRINYFAWTVAILLLIGFALAAWLGSFYIFNQPERPDSYRILQRLHKIEAPKRFELTSRGRMPSWRAIIFGIIRRCAVWFPM